MNEQNAIEKEFYNDLEKAWIDVISLAERELDKKILPLFPLEKQERINMAYEKICEITDLEERAFVLIAYVNELKRINKIYEDLMGE